MVHIIKSANGKGKIEKVALDLDDTNFFFRTPFLRFFNLRQGTNFSVRDVRGYTLHRSLGVPGSLIYSEMMAFYQTQEFRQIPLAPYAKQVAKTISKKKEVGVITARPDLTREVTIEHVARLCPKIREVYFTNEFGGNSGTNRKSEYCIRHGYGAIVEDSVEYATECAEQGILAFLLPQPWNLDARNLHPNIRRINDLRDLLNQPELMVA